MRLIPSSPNLLSHNRSCIFNFPSFIRLSDPNPANGHHLHSPGRAYISSYELFRQTVTDRFGLFIEPPAVTLEGLLS
jgi:hypothetical protein